MTTIALIFGILLPSLAGWVMIRIVEGSDNVFMRSERAVLSFLFGSGIYMNLLFLSNVFIGVPLTLRGYITVLAFLYGMIGVFYLVKSRNSRVLLIPLNDSSVTYKCMLTLGEKIIVAILGSWTIIKFASGSVLLFATPPYFYDTLLNWNMRGKIFFYQMAISHIPYTLTVDLDSYPPSLSLMKAWLSTLAGHWSEPLANGIHFFWLLAAIVLVYTFLKRHVKLFYAFLGSYILSSLPLYMLQGVSAFADVYLSVHILLSVTLLYEMTLSVSQSRRDMYSVLFAISLGLLALTKNEGLVLYLPVILFAYLISIFKLWKMRIIHKNEIYSSFCRVAGILCVFVLPWVVYKLQSGMTFGNAKPLSDMAIGFYPRVIKTIFVMTFLEGNWHFLFLLFLGLVIVRFRDAFQWPVVLLSSITLILYITQILLHVFTRLAIEALIQTGYARGIIHIAPLICILVVILASNSHRSHASFPNQKQL